MGSLPFMNTTKTLIVEKKRMKFKKKMANGKVRITNGGRDGD